MSKKIPVKKRVTSLQNKLTAIVQTRAIAIGKDLYSIAINSVPQGTTPVWSGSFIASWNLSIGSPNFTYTLAKPKDPENPLSPKPMPEIKFRGTQFTSKTAFDTIYLTNAVPYAKEIQVLGTKYSEPEILQRIIEAQKRILAPYDPVRELFY